MKQTPSIDQWLAEAKASPEAAEIGMYLTHNGVVRITPKKQARAQTDEERAAGAALGEVVSVDFSYDAEGLERAIADARTWPGVHYVRVWLNEGTLKVGDSLMYVLIGADIRPNAIDALQRLVGNIKENLVVEHENYA
ncbi:MAG: molybdenum cofactor biosynthesis protein MoaE [bacterium]|nr:molybdenum cofactor biosynthesis protein MoaE [bacterium]